MKTLILLAAMIGSGAANAAVTGPCDGLDSIGNLVEPVRGYAQGAIRIAHVSTEEPAAAPDHVLVFVDGPEMTRSCVAVSDGVGARGFATVSVAKIQSSYDPKTGLHLTIPVSATQENGIARAAFVKVRIDRTNAYAPKVTIE